MSNIRNTFTEEMQYFYTEKDKTMLREINGSMMG